MCLNKLSQEINIILFSNEHTAIIRKGKIISYDKTKYVQKSQDLVIQNHNMFQTTYSSFVPHTILRELSSVLFIVHCPFHQAMIILCTSIRPFIVIECVEWVTSVLSFVFIFKMFLNIFFYCDKSCNQYIYIYLQYYWPTLGI